MEGGSGGGGFVGSIPEETLYTRVQDCSQSVSARLFSVSGCKCTIGER